MLQGSCVIGRLKYFADHIRGFPVFITLINVVYSCDRSSDAILQFLSGFGLWNERDVVSVLHSFISWIWCLKVHVYNDISLV